MKKIYNFITIAVVMVLATPLAYGQYHAGDSAAIRAIASTNFTATTTLNWAVENDPGMWVNVDWDTTVTPYRVIRLHMGDSKSGFSSPRNNSWWESRSYNKSPNLGGSSVNADLADTIDFTAFTELQHLDLRRNLRLKGINVSGLTKLESVYLCRSDSVGALDFSGLTSLVDIHAKRLDGLKTLNASGCSNLTMITLAWGNKSLNSLDLTGCTNLEMINVKDCNLKSIDLTGMTGLKMFKASNNDSLTTILNWDQCSNIFAFTFSKCDVTGDFDVTKFDTTRLYKFSCGQNQVTSVDGLLGMDSMYSINVEMNRLSLESAVQINNTPNFVENNLKTNNQIWPAQRTIIAPDSIDHTPEDSVDVNGTNVGTSFELFKVGVGSQGTFTSGMFNFALADTGQYYIVMTNSGTTVTTDTITVLAAGAIIVTTIDNTNFGNVNIGMNATRTVTVANEGNIDLNVSNVTLPSGYTISSTTGTIAAGSSLDYTVTFTPTMAQTYSGEVNVASSAVANAGNNTVMVTGVGIDVTDIAEEVASRLSFYPVPTTDVLFVKDLTGGTIHVLNLYDANGALVKTIKLNQSIAQIQVSDLTKGIYFIRSVDGSIQQKIVKY